VLAHPERYQYMTMEKAEELKDRGVLLQVNIPSIVGYYGKSIEKMAIKLIEAGWVDLLGSDCHNMLQCKAVEDAFHNKNFKKALDLPLLNNSL
jgi:protein-tyrosine phosphatase